MYSLYAQVILGVIVIIMTFERIRELIDYLPDTSSYFREVLNFTRQVTAVNKFMCAYKDLSFGYRFIKALIRDNIRLPSAVHETYLRDLYNFEKFGDTTNDYLIFALGLHHPSSHTMEETIRAFLITDTPFSKLSSITGISEDSLRCYEQIFYNIRDRKNESLFIANHVYPQTRLVEMDDNYAKTESFGTLILRSAYNNGLEDAAYFAGLKMANNVLNEKSAAVSASQLEAAIMANAHFLVRNGYINQRHNSISSAKGLLIAAKQGGTDTANADTEGLGSLGESIWDAIHDIKGPEIQEKLDAITELEMSKYESSKS